MKILNTFVDNAEKIYQNYTFFRRFFAKTLKKHLPRGIKYVRILTYSSM